MRSWPVESRRWVKKVVNLRWYERENRYVLRLERNWLRERDSVLNGRGVGEDGVGIYWEKDLRLVEREFQRRREAFRKERSENSSFDVSSGKEKQRWSDDRFFASGFDIDKLAKVTGLRFMKEIVGNGDYFELNTLFDLEPMKWFIVLHGKTAVILKLNRNWVKIIDEFKQLELRQSIANDGWHVKIDLS